MASLIRLLSKASHRGTAAFSCAMALCLGLGSPARACGYDNPDDVAQYLINIAYPKALYLRDDIRLAIAAGQLPDTAGQKPLPNPFAFMKVMARLRSLATALQPMEPAGQEVTFAVVLLEAALWTRYVTSADGYKVISHVSGPEKNEVVVITDASVIVALLDGGLTFSEAYRSGLLRFYGPDKVASLVRKAFGGLQRDLRQETGDQAVKLTNRSMSQTADTMPMP